MPDLTLILDRKELVVRMESKSIRIDRPDGLPERVPLKMIDSVIVIGSPMVSCDVWRALAEHNISAVLFPSRGGGVSTYMSGGLSRTATTRIAQHRAACDPNTSLKVARWLLRKKLEGQENVIEQLKNCRDLEPSSGPIRQSRAKLNNATDRNSLMGIEGSAAAAYFGSFAKIIPPKWKFKGRNRRPPRDPVNALLSLGYVLAGSEVRRAIQSKGLDPAVGFLHSPQPGRESLVLDILEPLRPEIDWFVLELLDSPLNLRDFTTNDQDGCLLNKGGRGSFFKAWAEWGNPDAHTRRLTKMADTIVQRLIELFPTA